jgi:hypothetical protein
MQEPNVVLFILSGVNALLLGSVGFFLRTLHSRFDELEREVKGSLIGNAVESQRIHQIEKDLSELKQIVMSNLFANSTRARKV